jgi:hypothetical protein
MLVVALFVSVAGRGLFDLGKVNALFRGLADDMRPSRRQRATKRIGNVRNDSPELPRRAIDAAKRT